MTQTGRRRAGRAESNEGFCRRWTDNCHCLDIPFTAQEHGRAITQAQMGPSPDRRIGREKDNQTTGARCKQMKMHNYFFPGFCPLDTTNKPSLDWTEILINGMDESNGRLMARQIGTNETANVANCRQGFPFVVWPSELGENQPLDAYPTETDELTSNSDVEIKTIKTAKTIGRSHQPKILYFIHLPFSPCFSKKTIPIFPIPIPPDWQTVGHVSANG